MRPLAACIFTFLALALSPLPAPTAAPFDSCSCASDDGLCEASVACPGGCMAFCPNGGCRAMCTSNTGPTTMMQNRVSLNFKGSTSREVSAELARVTGQDIVYLPSTSGATVNLDVHDLPLWDVLEMLAAGGRLRIGGDDFSNLQTVRRALLYRERISVCVHGTTVKRFLAELEYLTGLDISVTSGDKNAKLNFTAKGVNFDEIIVQVSERARVQILVR